MKPVHCGGRETSLGILEWEEEYVQGPAES